MALGGQLPADAACYVDSSGTSMAAPHVSGAIAAFLSVHREFIGRPDDVKRIFLKTATSLGRETHLPGEIADPACELGSAIEHCRLT